MTNVTAVPLNSSAVSLFDGLSLGVTPPIATKPVALVIFGGAGDLAHRKLLPALYNLHLDGLLPPRFAAVGIGRRGYDDEAYRDFARDGIPPLLETPDRRRRVVALRAVLVLRQRVD